MKKFFLFVIVNIFIFRATSQVEVYGRYTEGGKVAPDINVYGEKKISKKISLTYFTLVEEKWAEALIGTSYSPTDWFSAGISAGIEQNPALFRMAGSLWFGKGKTSLLLLGEKGSGPDNYWYKTTLSYKFSDKFSFAARAWRYHGVGPVATFFIKKLASSIWIMPAYDFEVDKKKLVFGFDIKI
ncbi:MAG TPA: hypothetical protein VG982_03160 [Candidatus Paceibacterota bacterium]|nr:hypothetical protein [Candidatus Paceibacterota bacterium]